LNATTHVPAALKVTLPDASVQPLEAELSVMATASPDVAVAVGEYEPRTLPAEGAALALMVFAVVPTAPADGEKRSARPLAINTTVAVMSIFTGANRAIRNPADSLWDVDTSPPLSSLPDELSGQGKRGLDVLRISVTPDDPCYRSGPGTLQGINGRFI
jgi:hypothetical protein